MLKPKDELRKSQGLGSDLRWPHATDGMLKPKNEVRRSQVSVLALLHYADLCASPWKEVLLSGSAANQRITFVPSGSGFPVNRALETLGRDDLRSFVPLV